MRTGNFRPHKRHPIKAGAPDFHGDTNLHGRLSRHGVETPIPAVLDASSLPESTLFVKDDSSIFGPCSMTNARSSNGASLCALRVAVVRPAVRDRTTVPVRRTMISTDRCAAFAI